MKKKNCVDGYIQKPQIRTVDLQAASCEGDAGQNDQSLQLIACPTAIVADGGATCRAHQHDFDCVVPERSQ